MFLLTSMIPRCHNREYNIAIYHRVKLFPWQVHAVSLWGRRGVDVVCPARITTRIPCPFSRQPDGRRHRSVDNHTGGDRGGRVWVRGSLRDIQ